jgi:hypothetical protein
MELGIEGCHAGSLFIDLPLEPASEQDSGHIEIATT